MAGILLKHAGMPLRVLRLAVWAGLCPLAATLFGTSASFADDTPNATSDSQALPASAPAVSTAPHERWYGWETLASDGAAVGLALVGIGAHSTGCGYAALITYALGGPLIHLINVRPATAAADLALRFFAPIALGLVGLGIGASAASGACQGELADCVVQAAATVAFGVIVGATVGGVTAVAIDASVLARPRH
jgi:hypothetical protein